jgi:ADP-heptose:LPS heptosyltransferase
MRELDLVAAIGYAGAGEWLSLRVPDAAREVTRRRLAALGLDHRRWVLLHPSATGRVTPRYPAERFAAAARACQRRRLRRASRRTPPSSMR